MGQDDTVRLYSRGYRDVSPPDTVPEHHRAIHAELEAWARWCWDKWQPKTCNSIERQFDPGEGGRSSRPARVALPENPRMLAIDRAIRHMRMVMPEHGEALRLFYSGERRRLRSGQISDRYSPAPWWAICRILHISTATFPRFMSTARAALLNVLRRLEAGNAVDLGP